jgi:hypothetical protein
MPESTYRISMWGKLDKQKPLKPGPRTTYLKLQTDFFKNDSSITPVGEPIYRIQPIPGSKNRDPIFNAEKWNEFFVEIESPKEAALMVITLKFETGSDEGKCDGAIYFDDFAIDGPAGGGKKPAAKTVESPVESPGGSLDTLDTAEGVSQSLK